MSQPNLWLWEQQGKACSVSCSAFSGSTPSSHSRAWCESSHTVSALGVSSSYSWGHQYTCKTIQNLEQHRLSLHTKGLSQLAGAQWAVPEADMNANECAAARRSQCKGQEPWNESLEALSALRGWSASWYQSPLPAGGAAPKLMFTQMEASSLPPPSLPRRHHNTPGNACTSPLPGAQEHMCFFIHLVNPVGPFTLIPGMITGWGNVTMSACILGLSFGLLSFPSPQFSLTYVMGLPQIQFLRAGIQTGPT